MSRSQVLPRDPQGHYKSASVGPERGQNTSPKALEGRCRSFVDMCLSLLRCSCALLRSSSRRCFPRHAASCLSNNVRSACQSEIRPTKLKTSKFFVSLSSQIVNRPILTFAHYYVFFTHCFWTRVLDFVLEPCCIVVGTFLDIVRYFSGTSSDFF